MLRMDFKSAIANNIIVSVEEALDSTVEYGSLKLDIDPYYHPTHFARIYGIVEAVPQGKVYSDDGKEIEPLVQVGDKVYFHYLTTCEEANCVWANYYKVPYFWIFCIVRGERIIPVGGWTLCEKVEEEEYTKIIVDGKEIYVTEAGGIISGINQKPSIKYARLAHIGEPPIGEEKLDASVGDIVVLADNSNFVNKIEGKEYYTVKQNYILGKKCV
jgi:co-chaperonin GroES (HSP10)